MSALISEGAPVSVDAALSSGKQRSIILTGQLDRNQGAPTFTGRMTLEQFADITVVHNRKWVEEAGESLDQVTQREISDPHASALAVFILKGLVNATLKRADGSPIAHLVDHLREIQDQIGTSKHYGIPPVTLVLPRQPEIRQIKDQNDQDLCARMIVPAGVFFYVADGQHRREAARLVKSFLNEVIGNRHVPKGTKLYPDSGSPISAEMVEAWGAIQETFRGLTVVAYEAHIGLDVDEARQMFTNYNCHVKPVKAELNLDFDKSNPINLFGKELLANELKPVPDETNALDVRQVARINGFLFMGNGSIKSAPFTIANELPIAKEFWNYVLTSPEWKRVGSYLREVPLLKALAKAWFYVFIAKRNRRPEKAAQLRSYIRSTKFDLKWMEGIPGLKDHMLPTDHDPEWKFGPTHNDIVAKIVSDVLK